MANDAGSGLREAAQVAVAEIRAIGQAWRNDWSDFDGRTLKGQLITATEPLVRALASYPEAPPQTPLPRCPRHGAPHCGGESHGYECGCDEVGAAAPPQEGRTAENACGALKNAWRRLRAVLDLELPAEHFPGVPPDGDGACPESEGGECDCGAQARNLEAGAAEAEMEKAISAIGRALAERDEALRDAMALIEHAWDEPRGRACGPWCNGVHEAGLCEGSVHASEMMQRLRALAGAPPETAADEGQGT